MLTTMTIIAFVFFISSLCLFFTLNEEKQSGVRQRAYAEARQRDLLEEAVLREDRYKELFAASDRDLNSLRDNVKDTVRILAEHRPITYDVYKLLVADCACDYCVELFRDYLDFSEGIAADAAPTLAQDVLSFKEEPTGRGNTVEMPIPTIIVNPTAAQLGITE